MDIDVSKLTAPDGLRVCDLESSCCYFDNCGTRCNRFIIDSDPLAKEMGNIRKEICWFYNIEEAPDYCLCYVQRNISHFLYCPLPPRCDHSNVSV